VRAWAQPTTPVRPLHPPPDLPIKGRQAQQRRADRGEREARKTPRDRRFQLSLGLAVGASLGFLAFLEARPASDGTVKLVANLAQLLAPTLAAASCAWAAASGSGGRYRRAWALLAASAGSWAAGQAIWVWYEHVAQRELPFPSLADVGYLGAIPLAVAAMLAFPGQAERAVLQVRSLLDGGMIATSLLYTSWSLVLGPVFRAGQGGELEQAIVLAYPAGDVVLATIVLVVVARIRVGGAPVLLLGAGLLSLAVADSSFAYLTQEGTYSTGPCPTSAGSPATCWWRWRPAGPPPSGSPGSGGGRAGSRSCCRTARWPWPWPPRPCSSCGASPPGRSCTGRSWPWGC